MKAFPTVNWAKQQGQPPNDEGMDLRDYFAAKIIEGLMQWIVDMEFNNSEKTPLSMAEVAYEYADAMMEAREK